MSAIKTQVDKHLNLQSVNTYTEMQTFRKLPRRSGTMATVVAAVQTELGSVWVGRRQIRKWALRLFNEGAL